MTVSAEIVPFYFGTPGKTLFGCFHAPDARRTRNCAVAICQPMGHEYVNSHRALRQLAVHLADAGFPVLRFDYFGCGDSSGEAEEGRTAQWLDDISQAVLEAKRRTGVPRICLIGLRLGADLSLLAAAHRCDVASLVLWDAVISGKSYLASLASLQKEMLRFRPKSKRDQKSEWPMDIIGFPVSRNLYSDIEAIDLLAISKRSADNVLLIETEGAAAQGDLKRVLAQRGASVSMEHVNAPQIWLPTVDGSLLVPVPVLHSVTSWMSRVHP
jgi:pimeloyl-ACP methyl ester carboxylesterase